MATEGPLLHDGSQCVAAANYGNGANLAGTNTGGTTGGSTGSGQFLSVQVTAARTVTVTPTANSGQAIYGILQNKPAAAQVADVGFIGVTKAVADSAGVTAGNFLMASSNTAGCMMAWTTTHYAVGIALETAAAGQVFSMMLFPMKYT